MLEDLPWWVAGKKYSDRCLSVCLFVQALWPLEPERLVRARRANVRSMAGAAERRWCQLRKDRLHVTCATLNLANPCKKKSFSQGCKPNQWTDLTHTWAIPP